MEVIPDLHVQSHVEPREDPMSYDDLGPLDEPGNPDTLAQKYTTGKDTASKRHRAKRHSAKRHNSKRYSWRRGRVALGSADK